VCYLLAPLGSCDNALGEAPEPEARRVVLSIAAGGGGARTAMPQHAAQYYYTLLASAPGNGIVFRDLGEKTKAELSLEPALWQFEVRGYLSPGKTEGPVLFGSGALDTAEDFFLAISLSAGTGAQGILAFTFGLPADVFSARMTLAPAAGSPALFDLLAGDHLSAPGRGSLDLPSGVYRLALELRNRAGKTALWNTVAHIRDAFATPVAFAFSGNSFTSLARFGSLDALVAWLSQAAPNTPDKPYPLELEGINVESAQHTYVDDLSWLYTSLQGRYLALDLDACTGASIPFSSLQSQNRPDKDKLVYLTLPRTIQGIGGYSFTNCVNLRSVVFPDSLQWIHQESFRGCASLASLDFPASLLSLSGTFLDCASLTTIVCRAPEPPELQFGDEFRGAPLQAIYVPPDSVEAYKTAPVWSKFAAIIRAIPPEA
jgi:hypothetical protein